MKQSIALIILTLLLSGCSLPFLGRNQSALQVNSSVNASVYLNGNFVGQTPFTDDNLKPGEYTVRLVVENNPAQDWQTRVTLSPHIITVLNREFGISDEQSSNYLLQLEPIANKSIAELSIVTMPDNSIVKINNQPQGISPITVSPIPVGDQQISLAAPGYNQQIINVQTKDGFRLLVSAQLAKTPALIMPEVDGAESTPSAQLIEDSLDSGQSQRLIPTITPQVTVTPTPAATLSPVEKPYVEITETGTGWLRVRDQPNINGTELAKVDVGSRLPYLETNDTGWHKVEYQPGQEGWVAGSYAVLYR
jgi:hypothetical protein